MSKGRISQESLRKLLANKTAFEAGMLGARALDQHIIIRRLRGDPNWDANCDIENRHLSAAFHYVLEQLRRELELEE